ncbi:replication-relaxation family protein [Bradyrhizobium sp. CCBAU 53338]|uniref:replication-relaxation family protein n=1 Tax=Bradyrhizobium sp. CCBAU 53338 TaxID=1325111 RepID=UPI00188A096F|nr:replication-relaxation family protein [Bradyrhizobium sp. CCBAU 53338]
MRITARDIALLRNIARFRLVSTADLALLDGGSAQNVSRSLLALWENGYVERPEAQVTSRMLYEGSRPTIYGLSRKGAHLLRSGGLEVPRRLLDGIDKERGAGWRFVQHTVEVASFLIALVVAVRKRSDLRLLSQGELLGNRGKKLPRQVKLEVCIRLDGVLTRNAVVPDALFGLQYDDGTESYFMLEIDRGEMPVERYRDITRTYFSKKLNTYWEAYRRRCHVTELGLESFRVLTVTTTRERVERMIAAVGRMTQGRGSNVFLFADQQMLSAAGSPLAVQWISGKGESVEL